MWRRLFLCIVAMTVISCRGPEVAPATDQPSASLEPQDAFRFPLENDDPRLMMLLPDDDRIVFAASSSRSAKVRMRIMVVDQSDVVICDSTKVVHLWSIRVEPVELPILNRYEIEPRGRRLFTVRVRILSQDVAQPIQFKLQIAGLTVSRPRNEDAPTPPTSVSELSEH